MRQNQKQQPVTAGWLLWRIMICLAVCSLVGCGGAGHPTQDGRGDSSRSTRTLAITPTYTKHVAPILFDHCATCHRPGEAAPFALLNYQDAQSRANQIADVTSTRYMPPWLPEPGFGHFSGQRYLNEAQLEILRQWAENGTPEGNPDDLPPVPKFPVGWQIGDPDLIVELPEPYTLRAGGSDVFHNFVIPIPVSRTHYVSAIDLRPENKKIVHHAKLLVDQTRSCRRLDAQYPGPGFEGMAEGTAKRPDGHFLVWQPGTVPDRGSDELAWRLEPGSDLLLQMHLLPSGKPEKLQPKVGFYFVEKPAGSVPMYALHLEDDLSLDISPGDADFQTTDTLTLPVDTKALRIMPHCHLLGKEIKGFAMLPDGSRKWLIFIKQWNFDWQAVYRFQQPVSLPKGTTLTMQMSFDNSADNPRNPSQPPQRVVGGDGTGDEMSHLWIQLLVDNDDDLLALQQVEWEHKLTKNPRDWKPPHNLGELHLSRQNYGQAIHHFQQALVLRPNSVDTHNDLGVALKAVGNNKDAIGHYQQALKYDPDCDRAHYNLGNALVLSGKMEDAVSHLRQAAKLTPHWAEFHLQLGMLLLNQRQYDESIVHCRRTLEIDSGLAEAYFGLGAGLAGKKQWKEAIDQLELALQIDSGLPEARLILARIHRAQGRPVDAGFHYQKLVTSNPSAPTHCELGNFLLAQGKLAEAMSQYRQALSIDPQFTPARRGLAKVREKSKAKDN